MRLLGWLGLFVGVVFAFFGLVFQLGSLCLPAVSHLRRSPTAKRTLPRPPLKTTHPGGKGFGDPVTFDNTYFTALIAKPWLKPNDPMAEHIGLPSDHALPEDPECLGIIKEYAADNEAFKRDFGAAYQRLVETGARWRDDA